VGNASALIANEDEYFRLALRGILVEKLNIRKVSEKEPVEDAIEFLSNRQGANLALFGIQIPGINTRNSIRAVHKTISDKIVVVVSASQSQNHILRCLEAGAHGYVHKENGPRGLTSALGLICEATVFLSPFMPRLALQHAFTGEVEEPQRDHASDSLQRKGALREKRANAYGRRQ
jgi:DNA-binding NarL/FixJ family response regulator